MDGNRKLAVSSWRRERDAAEVAAPQGAARDRRQTIVDSCDCRCSQIVAPAEILSSLATRQRSFVLPFLPQASSFVEQTERLGTGHAIQCARPGDFRALSIFLSFPATCR